MSIDVGQNGSGIVWKALDVTIGLLVALSLAYVARVDSKLERLTESQNRTQVEMAARIGDIYAQLNLKANRDDIPTPETIRRLEDLDDRISRLERNNGRSSR